MQYGRNLFAQCYYGQFNKRRESMGQIANQMAIELFFRIKERLKEKREEKLKQKMAESKQTENKDSRG